MDLTHIFWLLGAGVFGFVLAAYFGDRLHLSRRWFLVPYNLGIIAFLTAYTLLTGLDINTLIQRNLVWGLIAGVMVGAILVANVLSQPPSESGTGFDLLWAGIVYGTLDALLLSVMPVVAIWETFGFGQNIVAQVGIATLALLGSVYVTAVYHLGYPEFRGPQVGMAVFGNVVITLAVLLTGNPLAAVISHAIMHMAAVLHGPETTIQLPPHHEAGPHSLRKRLS